MGEQVGREMGGEGEEVEREGVVADAPMHWQGCGRGGGVST